MKLVVVSHSLIHPRQKLFFKELSKLTEHLWAVGPRFWHDTEFCDEEEKSYTAVGLPVRNPGDIFNYYLDGLDMVIKEVKPHLIYCQAELSSQQALKTLLIKVSTNMPFVIFVWENIKPPTSNEELEILNEAALVICGNLEAKKLIPVGYQNKVIVLPQVGIATELFKPMPEVTKKYDVIYCGREATEKGIDIIREGCQAGGYSVRFVHHEKYLNLPTALNEARVFASLPITLKTWKEQSGSYSNLEALACGLPVITTRCGAIPEYLGDAALYCQENDVSDFIANLDYIFSLKAAEFAETIQRGLIKAEGYSNKNISLKLADALSNLC